MGSGVRFGGGKRQSKRQTTKLREKIKKKVRDHGRKLKKDIKKHPEKYRKSKKDPGVPNDHPFKEQILSEARDVVAKHKEYQERRRIELKEYKAKAKENLAHSLKGQSLEALMAKAQHKAKVFDDGQGIQESAVKKGLSDKSAKAYYKEFRKVVDAADVVLEVLDARDPMGSRCKEVEEAVMSGSKAGKRLVLVLNKADLVPRENLLAWMKHLRNEYPTIPFKASTQQTARLGQAKINMKQVDQVLLQTSKCVGADILLSLLANYCRNKDIKTSIKVGVVGMPNVGKSSLINSLKRSRACTTGATPGVTKVMQEVQLDKKVTLLDCPGLVMAGGNKTDASVALRNAIKVESLADPITPVVAILSRVPREHIMMQYRIGHFKDCAEFLSLVALSHGKLLRGGIPDRHMAARMILGDWNTGKIKYFTHPPEQSSPESFLGAEIVEQFASEFDLKDLDNKMDLNELPNVKPRGFVQVESSIMADNVIEIEDSAEPVEESESGDESMEESAEEQEADKKENLLPAIGVQKDTGREKKKKKRGEVAEEPKDEDDPLYKLEGNLKLKKKAKLQQKKIKKDRKRANKLGDELGDQMDSAFAALTGESYDFKTDFTDEA